MLDCINEEDVLMTIMAVTVVPWGIFHRLSGGMEDKQARLFSIIGSIILVVSMFIHKYLK